MSTSPSIKLTPWDSAIFGVDTYELTDTSPASLEIAARIPGHYTVRLAPLSSKQLLHTAHFYYCDTLIEPFCPVARFQSFVMDGVTINRNAKLDSLLKISHGAFSHGRFHRDFNLSPERANLRYDNWLVQLYESGHVHGLFFHGELIGFIAVNGNKLILHAIAKSFRGRGLAKFLWTPVCQVLFEQGYDELVSSVSASNVAVLNLYAGLGFRFRNPVDLYHRLTK